jgi:hypothetical protein
MLPPHAPSKKRKISTRGKTRECVICGIKSHRGTGDPVCKKWRCEYLFTSERSAYWLQRAGVARTKMNLSNEDQVDDEGVGQASGSCKSCGESITNGCGDETCATLCPWCVCEKKLCRKRLFEQYRWFNSPRRCFAFGCDVVIPSSVLAVFGKDKSTSMVMGDGGDKYESCATCQDLSYPTIYCSTHREHYYHEWEEWLPAKKPKKVYPVPKPKNKRQRKSKIVPPPTAPPSLIPLATLPQPSSTTSPLPPWYENSLPTPLYIPLSPTLLPPLQLDHDLFSDLSNLDMAGMFNLDL